MIALDVYPLLGRAVAKRREQLQLTQAEVASRIGLTRASLANIETGRQKVLLHHIYLLAEALGLSSILDLVPAAFEGGVRDEPLALNIKVTPAQKAQLQSLVRQAMATGPSDKRQP
ncbi:MAG TPA: helix-turn-helix transcriptional regulator [Pirellulales bacterium]|jgi:transcriptional regulator with XRE-family HTH domain